jgi:phosphatidylglycerophosphate synthase
LAETGHRWYSSVAVESNLVERFYILAPTAAATSYVLVMFAGYCVLCGIGRTPQIGNLKSGEVLGLFWARYIVWLLLPVERVLIRSQVSPNIITGMSLACCAGAGLAVAFGHLATGAWLYILGGVFDLLDGRLARATGRQTQAGALFDSVADRWAELALFTGYAWYLRETPWLLAVMAATGSSMMVSYTRARGESLGLDLKGGAMQRPERILLVSVGTLVAAWMGAGESTLAWEMPAAGIALAICGVLSSWTALGRWIDSYRALLAREPCVERRSELGRVDRAAESAMRITGEHAA